MPNPHKGKQACSTKIIGNGNPTLHYSSIDGSLKYFIKFKQIKFTGGEWIQCAAVADNWSDFVTQDRLKVMFIYQSSFKNLQKIIPTFPIKPAFTSKVLNYIANYDIEHVNNKLHFKTVFGSDQYYEVMSKVCIEHHATFKVLHFCMTFLVHDLYMFMIFICS